MSDYLASLVTRARESQTAIRPAPTRQGEPASLTDGTGVEDQAGPTAPPASTRPSPPVTARPIREPARAEANQAEQRFNETDDFLASAQNEPAFSPAKALASGIAVGAASTPIESAFSPEPRSLRGSALDGQAISGVAGRGTVPPPTGKLSPPPRSSELVPRQSHRPVAAGFPVRPVAHQVRVAEERSLPLAAEPVPPAIHVTIGRVEVRAVVSKPELRTRSTGTGSKIVSLEEHLRRRTGGGGR
jgi:hypothetical protein